MIAGTYTPFLLTKLRGIYGWITFGLVWGLALATLVAKLVLTEKFAKPPVWWYVVMGWLALLVFNQAMRTIDTASLPFSHAIWHLLVIGGSACHFFSVMPLV